ncbi:MAG TPA: hypothetical protein VIM37_00620 [Candidatus Microsaccharimonas sp.]
MSEKTETPQLENTEPSFDEHWNDIDLMARAAEASRVNYIADAQKVDEGTDIELTLSQKNFRKGVAAGVIATTALAGGAALIHEANQGPTFSESTNEYVVTAGDGLYNAAEQIKGIDQADIREAVQHISVDPSNIDVLKDGLQPGEILVIPDSVQK